MPYPILTNPVHEAKLSIEVVTQEEGKNMVIISSLVSVRNNTKTTLYVCMMSAEQLNDPTNFSRELRGASVAHRVQRGATAHLAPHFT